MKLFKLYRIILLVLVGIASFLPMLSIVLGFRGDGGGA